MKTEFINTCEKCAKKFIENFAADICDKCQIESLKAEVKWLKDCKNCVHSQKIENVHLVCNRTRRNALSPTVAGVTFSYAYSERKDGECGELGKFFKSRYATDEEVKTIFDDK